MLAASKTRTMRRMVHLAVDFGQQVAVAAHQVRLDFQAEGQVAAVARFGDLPQLIDRLRQVILRIGSPGADRRKSRESAWSRRHGPARTPCCTSPARYFLIGTKTFFVPSSTSNSLTLPIGEPIDETFRPYSF